MNTSSNGFEEVDFIKEKKQTNKMHINTTLYRLIHSYTKICGLIAYALYIAKVHEPTVGISNWDTFEFLNWDLFFHSDAPILSKYLARTTKARATVSGIFCDHNIYSHMDLSLQTNYLHGNTAKAFARWAGSFPKGNFQWE